MLKKTLIITALSVLILSACTPGTPDELSVKEDTHEKLKIVTTFAPLYSFATNITGDLAEVTNLVPPGSSPHTWEPRSSDLKALADADILVMVGLELEPFIEDMIDSSQNSDLVVVVTHEAVEDYLMEMAEMVEPEGHEEEGHEHGGDYEEDEHHDHHHGGQDPHIWLDPTMAMKQVDSISDAIISLDPADSEAYQVNTASYLESLQRLDQEVKAALAAVTPKDFIVFHGAYGYFLEHYGIAEYQRASIEPFPGKEPTAAYFHGLVELIEHDGVEVIFTEPQFSATTVQNLQEETGVKSFEIDPIGLELSPVAYENNIRSLTQTFIEAFK